MARLPSEILQSAIRGFVRFERGAGPMGWLNAKRPETDVGIGKDLAICLHHSSTLTVEMIDGLTCFLDLYRRDLIAAAAPPSPPVGPVADGQEGSADLHIADLAMAVHP